jgi:hypothetical protein
MKTLRLLRNAAALFIIAIALFRPGVQPLHAYDKFCGYKPGYDGCAFDQFDHCSDIKCTPPYCSDTGCIRLFK